MVMSRASAPRGPVAAPAVVWHDLECGAYRADLALWLRLAAEADTPGGPARVLDIGAGTGRVALELARGGYPVTAVDLDPVLIQALIERAAGLPVKAVTADARTLDLTDRDHDLGLVPMQTLQLLRGAAERLSLLERARAHLRPDALLALAIVTDVESFDSRAGGLGPAPEHVRMAGRLYLSRAIRVEVGEQFMRIERERFVEPDEGDGTYEPELDVIELERLSPEQLHEEARAAGWRTEPTVRIGETADHAGSEVVMLRV
jgi:SAM-dependent methyltransferase